MDNLEKRIEELENKIIMLEAEHNVTRRDSEDMYASCLIRIKEVEDYFNSVMVDIDEKIYDLESDIELL